MDKQKLATYLKFGLAAVLLGIGGFAAVFLIKSLVVLATVSIGGLVLWNALPSISQWASQMNIAGQKYLAAKNPIPELILQRQKQQETIDEAIKQVTILGTETRQYKQDLDGFKRTDPDQADSFEETYVNMTKIYGYQVTKIKMAQLGQKEFDKVIAKSQRVWDMTKAAIRANKAMKGFQQPDPMAEIRKQTALDAVSKNMHQAMEEMKMSLMLDYNSLADLEKTPQVAHDPSEILEADFSTVKEASRV